MDKRLIVLFPGVNYSVDCPLLYYAEFYYQLKGYEVIEIESYNVEGIHGLSDLDTYAAIAEKNVKTQLQKVDWNQYTHIVFASKSIGTVIAHWLEDEWELSPVTHILLTPLNQTLPYMEKERDYQCIVTGTEDSFVDMQRLKKVCQQKNYPLTVIDGVGHRLETEENFTDNLKILNQIVKLYGGEKIV